MLYEIKWKTNQKIRNKKYETVGIVPKSKTKSIPLTYKIIHDRSLSHLGTETSIKSDEVKLDYAAMKVFSHVGIYQTLA